MSVLGAQLAVGEGIAATGIADEVIPAEKVERKPSGDGPKPGLPRYTVPVRCTKVPPSRVYCASARRDLIDSRAHSPSLLCTQGPDLIDN
jgi:hypothetical protein